MTIIPDVKMLTAKHVARVLDVSAMTVYRLIQRGDLTAHRVGHAFRIDPRDFADYMRGNTNGTEA